jgi:hypothetical protein
MKTFIIALTLASSVALAQTVPVMYAMDDHGMEYPALQTESNWMSVEVPLAMVGGSMPSDLSIATSGLPAGTTITLKKADLHNEVIMLHVKVKRTDAAKKERVDCLAQITVKSGGQDLATLAVPVLGIAMQ